MKKDLITPPAYRRGDRQTAKEMNCPLFTLDLDERHVVGPNKGRRHIVQGILHPEWAIAARLFEKALGRPLVDDKKRDALRVRDFEDKPYSPDEARVAEYLFELTNGNVGAGDDPIGFLIASHRMLRALKDS